MKTETKMGLKEAATAILAAIGVGCAIGLVMWMLTGCAGGYAFAKYEHHSSIPDYHDRNTADMIGFPCLHVDLAPRATVWKPSMEGCVNFEVHDKEGVFGRNPSGELSIRVPVPGASW